MKLIVGLGNPGKKYSKNRHNVGFMVIDDLSRKLEFPEFTEESKFQALISEKNINGEKVLLVKPLTYMNLSGETVSSLVQFYKIPLADVFVCYDDLDLPLGAIRFREKGSGGTHNGMKSIIEQLGTQDFSRFRVGIESRGLSALKQQETTDFVLGNFSAEEKKIVNKAIEEVGGMMIKALGARL